MKTLKNKVQLTATWGSTEVREIAKGGKWPHEHRDPRHVHEQGGNEGDGHPMAHDVAWGRTADMVERLLRKGCRWPWKAGWCTGPMRVAMA